VISTCGDTHLGGDDFDEELINHVAGEFKRDHGIDLRRDTMALQRLQEACEKAKKELSSLPQTDINLPFITADASGPKHLQMTITRSKFEELIDPLVERCRKPLTQALQDANLKPGDIDEIVLVGGSTRVPKVRQMVKEMFHKEPHQGVNPDEVVAVGAAIQGSVLAGDRKDLLLLDVTPLTLGIETEGGILTPLVERNTTIPVEKKNIFSTAADMQTAVTVKVFQGERKMAAHNRLLGEFNLEGIPPAPRGVPQIEVKFDIDQNGILNVAARDTATSKEAKIRIEQSAGLSDDEIDRMRHDAETHAEEDRRQFELAEARNHAEQACYQLEKQIREHTDTLAEQDRAPLEKAIQKTREVAKGDDAPAIRAAIGELEQASQAFGKILYERAQNAAQSGPAPTGEAGEQPGRDPRAGGDDDAIDAEFEVKDS
jgi:molecular chaperone DnaK